MTGMRWVATVVVIVLAQAVVVRHIAGRGMLSTQQNAGYHVLGVPDSGIDCGAMTSNLRYDRQKWASLYKSYAVGFITGANYVSYVANRRNANVGAFDAPPDVMFASVEQYCGENPSKNIQEAVQRVYSELEARSAKQ